MTTSAKTNFGAELHMVATGGSLAQVSELLSVTPPNQTREVIDATSHDSSAGAMEFLAEGIYDAGEISGQVNYIAGSTDDDAFLAAVTGGGLYDFKIVLKASSSTEDITFSGYVTAYGPDDVPVGGKQTASFTVKISGAVSQAATA